MCSVVDRWCGQGTLEMLSNFFIVYALSDKLLRLSSPGNLPRVCVSYQPSASLHCSFDLLVVQKILTWVFCEKLSGKHGIFGKIFVSRYLFVYLTRQLSVFWTFLLWDDLCKTMAGLRRLLGKQKFLLQLVFVWSEDSYLEYPLVSLLVVLYFISSDFAKCSLALHKRMVSDVIQNLSIVASFALGTLALLFLLHSVQKFLAAKPMGLKIS